MAKFDSETRYEISAWQLQVVGTGLAAAQVAAAAKWPIDVCIPPDADQSVIVKLKEVGADVHVCSRSTHMLKRNWEQYRPKVVRIQLLLYLKILFKTIRVSPSVSKDVTAVWRLKAHKQLQGK